MTVPADLQARARAWADADPDPETKRELLALLDATSDTDLADRFAGRLEFGTAGLRGVIGAGPNRMNRAVVLETTYGLAEWVKTLPQGTTRGVVIGYDGRRLSRELAEDTALVLAAAGVRTFLFDDLVPTPLVGFACIKLATAAGVMITASHNPPEYNGYKVYGPSGAQIVPPADTDIAAAIARAPAAKDVKRADRAEALAAGVLSPVPASIRRDYLDRVQAMVGDTAKDARTFPIVYTPMHGVGGSISVEAFRENGFTNVFPVKEQFEPDGAFPTVAFPNPEEKGAMDLSLALAKKENAELVIANDPDADRLAVAVPKGNGEYVQLTGNQVGVLLGHWLLTRSGASAAKKLVITTIVSSPQLGQIARALGAAYDETLTGFKWIATRAMEREKSEGLEFVFGYEEALGYTVGTLVRDKDGVGSAAMFATMVADLKSRGVTVLQELENIAQRYGLYVSEQVSVTKKGASGIAEIKALMQTLRAKSPAAIGPLAVVTARDYQAREQVDRKTNAKSPLTLPPSDVVAFELEGGSRVIARPSGTEPKIKFYFDVREPVANGETVAQARPRAEAKLAAIKSAFIAEYAK